MKSKTVKSLGDSWVKKEQTPIEERFLKVWLKKSVKILAGFGQNKT